MVHLLPRAAAVPRLAVILTWTTLLAETGASIGSHGRGKCSVKVGSEHQGRSIALGEPLLRVFRELMQRVNVDGMGSGLARIACTNRERRDGGGGECACCLAWWR